MAFSQYTNMHETLLPCLLLIESGAPAGLEVKGWVKRGRVEYIWMTE
jgi:hypothetical protein